MKILYVANGIPVPGALGGSTHTLEVARGLAERGHTLHVAACSHQGWGGIAALARPVSTLFAGFHLHYLDVPKAASLLTAPVLMRLARATRPDIVMERYYNFAGGGVWAARRLGIPTLLEVNALIVDPPQVFKRRLDDALGGPMRRWALAQCRWADRIVTPLHTTVPPEIPRWKIVELPWGANVGRFADTDFGHGYTDIVDASHTRPFDAIQAQSSGSPDAADTIQAQSSGSPDGADTIRAPSGGSPDAAGTIRAIQAQAGGSPDAADAIRAIRAKSVCVFLGSFRAWHGAIDFVKAAAMLLGRGYDCQFLLIGDGPERAAAERLAAAWPGRFIFTGAVPYEQVPSLLARATVGVAPFNTARHPALRSAGFFWSPLKVYEYMAVGLPVVTADIEPLNQIIRDRQEGLLFAEGDIPGLAAAIARILDAPAAARALGRRARARVAERYSWARHCQELERVMLEIVGSA